MEKMENRFSVALSKVNRLKLSYIVLFAVLLLAASLRLYRISEYMTFLGDEGRDVIVSRNILKGDMTLLGPRSSAADFFYGPIYYYMISPFLLLFNYDPVGPAVMVALIGIATVWLVYKVGSDLFDETAGLISASLYAVSPLVIAYSRSSWNPNPLPFVSLLALYLTYKSIVRRSKLLWIIVGILLGIAIQMQYLSLFLILIITLFVFLGSWFEDKILRLRYIFSNFIKIFAGFLIGWSLFLAFEVRHGFPNLKTIINFILFGNPGSQDAIEKTFNGNTSEVLFKLFARLIARFPPPEQVDIFKHPNIYWWHFAITIFIILALLSLIYYKNKLTVILISTWLFLGVFLFGFYNKVIHDYYLGFMFTLPFLLTGNMLSVIFYNERYRLLSKIIAIGIFLILFLFNLEGLPFRYAANNQRGQVEKISDFVMSKTDNKPFNFALMTHQNSDHAYRYFMEIKDKAPVEIKNTVVDPARNSITDQLLIVCEDPECRPLGSALWEVAGFGRAVIVGMWEVSVVKVYKLEHYYSN